MQSSAIKRCQREPGGIDLSRPLWIGFEVVVGEGSSAAGDRPTRHYTHKMARYSALAWMSELSPSCGIVMSLIASGVKERASAASISVARKTQGPAPVTATRTPDGVRATNTPTMA